jgi:hypothetical protein
MYMIIITHEHLCNMHIKKTLQASNEKRFSIRNERNEYGVSLPESWTLEVEMPPCQLI